MSPELQKYYEDRFSMMATKGWRELMEDVDTMINSLNNLAVIENESELQFKKGELSILSWLKSLKDASEHAFEDLS